MAACLTVYREIGGAVMSKNAYSFVNPSDPYTFVAEDYETAALTVLVFGTAYGATPKDDSGERVPVLLFDNADMWYKDTFGRTIEEGFEAKRDLVTDALLSFVLGDFTDRHRYESALNAITEPEKREQFKREWQASLSSMNNIGGHAHELGQRLKGERQ